jgi:hypothetical protein
MKRLACCLVVALAIVLVLGLPASADQSYHTSCLTLSLTAEGAGAGHPVLRNGFVANIHPNGPVNGAIEEYHLSGAMPNTEYSVFWDVVGFGMLPTGVGDQVTLFADENGNAQAKLKIPREWQLEMGFTNVDLTLRWVLKAGNVVAYATDWHDVHID